MAKSREKVQQLGFWDAEVSTPDHDAVCMWAYKNAEAIVRKARPDVFDRPWQSSDGDLQLAQTDTPEVKERRRSLANAFTEANPRPNPRIVRKTFEAVLKTYTGYENRMARIVGYADLLIETELPCIGPVFKPATPGTYADDVFDHFELCWRDRDNGHGRNSYAPRVLVEAKSVMPALGELMRQIQLYRTAFGGSVVVVSPDEKFAEILAEQDVTFIKYEP